MLIITSSTNLSLSYDRVAAEYAARIGEELAGKPLDRALLLALVEQVGALGPIADVGCGPVPALSFRAPARNLLTCNHF